MMNIIGNFIKKEVRDIERIGMCPLAAEYKIVQH